MPRSSAPHDASPVPKVAILGSDALLAARPATPVQLAHACLASGYDAVYPASWGDELIAAGVVRRLSELDGEPAIFCACPHVVDRLLTAGEELRRFLVSTISPAAATARYLRGIYGQTHVHITFIGACPGAADQSIDTHLTPADLKASFDERAIDVAAQPEYYDSVLPPDRRRSRSLPGGVPSMDCLASSSRPRSLVELTGQDYLVDLAQCLVSGRPSVIDVAARVGCACAGAIDAVVARDARAAIIALEPPRSPSPVLDPAIHVDVDVAHPAFATEARINARAAAEPISSTPEPTAVPATSAPAPIPRGAEAPATHATRSPSRRLRALDALRRQRHALARARRADGVPGILEPEGGTLPRAYVGRRRARVLRVEPLDFGGELVTPVVERERRIVPVAEPLIAGRRSGKPLSLGPLPPPLDFADTVPPPPAKHPALL